MTVDFWTDIVNLTLVVVGGLAWGHAAPLLWHERGDFGTPWPTRVLVVATILGYGVLVGYIGSRVVGYDPPAPFSLFWVRRAVWPIYLVNALVALAAARDIKTREALIAELERRYSA